MKIEDAFEVVHLVTEKLKNAKSEEKSAVVKMIIEAVYGNFTK